MGSSIGKSKVQPPGSNTVVTSNNSSKKLSDNPLPTPAVEGHPGRECKAPAVEDEKPVVSPKVPTAASCVPFSPIPGADNKPAGPFPPRCTKEELPESRDLAQSDLSAQQQVTSYDSSKNLSDNELLTPAAQGYTGGECKAPVVENQTPVVHPNVPTGGPFVPFSEFPSPALLAQAQRWFHAAGSPIPSAYDNLPGPFPPRCTKEELLENRDLAQIDLYAQQMPRNLSSLPLQKFVLELLKPAKDDIERARAIFVWIASQDLNAYEIHNVPDQTSALYRLLQIKAEMGDYTDLFIDMCSYAGITTKKLRGMCKAHTYKIGHDVTGSNSWAAVYVDNNWRFVDAHWGSSHLENSGDDQWVLVTDEGDESATNLGPSYTAYQMDDFYFFTDPEAFVYTHLAQDEEWQLLARPVKYNEYKEMAYLQAGYFDCKFEDLSQRKCLLRSHKGQINIAFDMPKRSYLKFSNNFYKSSDMTGTHLKRFVYTETRGDKKIINVKFQKQGIYKLEVFAGRGNSHECIAVYVIECDEPDFGCEPLPMTQANEFGPGANAQAMGLEAIGHEGGTVHAQCGEAVLRFHMNYGERVFTHNLISDKYKGDQLKQYAHWWTEGDEAIYHLKVPEHGQYIFELFSKEKGEKDWSDSMVCRYLVTSDMGCVDLTPFPSVGQLGEIERSDDLAPIPISHQHPHIEVGKDEVDSFKLSMETHPDAEYSVKMKYISEDSEEDVTDYIWIETSENQMALSPRFKQAGYYVIKFFAKNKDDSGSFPAAFNYFLDVESPSMNVLPYPKRYNNWNNKTGNILYGPMDGLLAESSKHQFDLTLPSAEDVAVLVDGKWNHLERNENGQWQGQVEMGASGTQVTVLGKTDPSKTNYTYFLGYSVISANDMQKKQDDIQEAFHTRVEKLKKRKQEQQDEAERRKTEHEKLVEKKKQQFHSNGRHTDDDEEKKKEQLEREEARRKYEEEAVKMFRMAEQDEALRLEREKLAAAEEVQQGSERAKCRIQDEIDNMQKNDNRETQEAAARVEDKAVRSMKENLRKEAASENQSAIEAAIKAAEKSGDIPETDKDLLYAKHRLEILQARQRLRAAIEGRQLGALQSAMQYVRRRDLQGYMKQDIAKAEQLMEILQRVNRLSMMVMKMDRGTMSELRSYKNPPHPVHRVLQGAFLLLGDKEKKTENWATCQTLCETSTLSKHVKAFDVHNVDAKTASNSKDILKKFSYEEVQMVSPCAATFHKWALGCIKEVETINENKQG